jgi:hypothetical protein
MYIHPCLVPPVPLYPDRLGRFEILPICKRKASTSQLANMFGTKKWPILVEGWAKFPRSALFPRQNISVASETFCDRSHRRTFLRSNEVIGRYTNSGLGTRD